MGGHHQGARACARGSGTSIWLDTEFPSHLGSGQAEHLTALWGHLWPVCLHFQQSQKQLEGWASPTSTKPPNSLPWYTHSGVPHPLPWCTHSESPPAPGAWMTDTLFFFF